MRKNLTSRFKHGIYLVLDLLFPPSKRERMVRTLAPEALSTQPLVRRAHERAIISLAVYEQPAVRDAIRTLKFERSMHAAHLFAALLADYLLESLAEEAMFGLSDLVLVPVPLGIRRKTERGYNQVALVLEALAEREADIRVRSDILLRRRETAPQTRLSRRKRLKNVSGAFAVKDGVSVQGMRILLIDDVTTTGATLHHAARALEKAGAKVTALALARA